METAGIDNLHLVATKEDIEAAAEMLPNLAKGVSGPKTASEIAINEQQNRAKY